MEDFQDKCFAKITTGTTTPLRMWNIKLQVDILKEAKKLDLDKGYFSVPTEISWKSANDEITYGNYYPPQVCAYFLLRKCNPFYFWTINQNTLIKALHICNFVIHAEFYSM